MCSFKREASSENYGPRVYFSSYIFRSIKPKTQKYLAAIYLPLLYFALLFIFYTYLYQIPSLQVTVKGLTAPFSCWVQVFICVDGSIGDLGVPPTGLIPWFSKTEVNAYATLLHHPFLFKGKPTQCSRGSSGHTPISTYASPPHLTVEHVAF